jgi:hypothetical protein
MPKPRTYTRTTMRLSGKSRTRTVRVEPAPRSSQGPLLLITADDEASHSGAHLTRRSCRFPRLGAWQYGRSLKRDGYTLSE